MQVEDKAGLSAVMSSLEGFKNQRMVYQQQANAIDEMKRKALQSNRLLSSSAQKENKFSPRKKTMQFISKGKGSASSTAFNSIDNTVNSETNKKAPLSPKKGPCRKEDSKAHHALQDKKYQEYMKSLQKQQQQRSTKVSTSQVGIKGKHSKGNSLAESQDISSTRIGSQKKTSRVASAKSLKLQSTVKTEQKPSYIQKSPRVAEEQTFSRTAQGTPKTNTFFLQSVELKETTTFLGERKEEQKQNFNVFLKDLQQKRQHSKEVETSPRNKTRVLDQQPGSFGFNPMSLMGQTQQMQLDTKNNGKKFLTKVSQQHIPTQKQTSKLVQENS